MPTPAATVGYESGRLVKRRTLRRVNNPPGFQTVLWMSSTDAYQATARLVFEHHLVEAETAGDGGDLEQTENAHWRRGSGWPGKSNEHVNTQAVLLAFPWPGILQHARTRSV